MGQKLGLGWEAVARMFRIGRFAIIPALAAAALSAWIGQAAAGGWSPLAVPDSQTSLFSPEPDRFTAVCGESCSLTVRNAERRATSTGTDALDLQENVSRTVPRFTALPPAETPRPLLPASRWMVGFYGGIMDSGALHEALVMPWKIKIEDSYLAAVSATYLIHEFSSLPMNLEADFVVAKRFGLDHEWDFGFLPMLRWKSLPWNDYLYTNIRLGLFGYSYATGISPFERNKGDKQGSHLLNFLVPELTFSSGPDASWETFVRIHHRSGVGGIYHGVWGGSNYLSVGFRQRL